MSRWGWKNINIKQFAIVCTFLLIIAHLFRRWKHMQKSLVWKGFLSESMQIEDYRNLSIFNKLFFWVNYPISYGRYLWVVVWDRIDRLSFRESRAGYTKIGSTNIGVKYWLQVKIHWFLRQNLCMMGVFARPRQNVY